MHFSGPYETIFRTSRCWMRAYRSSTKSKYPFFSEGRWYEVKPDHYVVTIDNFNEQTGWKTTHHIWHPKLYEWHVNNMIALEKQKPSKNIINPIKEELHQSRFGEKKIYSYE